MEAKAWNGQETQESTTALLSAGYSSLRDGWRPRQKIEKKKKISPAAPPTGCDGVELYVAVLSCKSLAASLAALGRPH